MATTTDTEDQLRNLEFRPGVKMAQIVKHEVIQVIGRHIDEQKPVNIKPGQVYWDKRDYSHILVTSHTGSGDTIHYVPLPNGRVMQTSTSQISRAQFTRAVREGLLVRMKFNNEEA